MLFDSTHCTIAAPLLYVGLWLLKYPITIWNTLLGPLLTSTYAFHLQIVSDENSASIFVMRTFCYECHSRNSRPRFSWTSMCFLDTDSDNAVPCTNLIALKI